MTFKLAQVYLIVVVCSSAVIYLCAGSSVAVMDRPYDLQDESIECYRYMLMHVNNILSCYQFNLISIIRNR